MAINVHAAGTSPDGARWRSLVVSRSGARSTVGT